VRNLEAVAAQGRERTWTSPGEVTALSTISPGARRSESRLAGAEKAPLILFILIDALGWQIVKDRPFLNKELSTRYPLTTVLGYSSGAIPTILTGLLPAENGRWNLFYYDPDGSPFRWLRWARWMPERMIDNRFVRKGIKELGRRVLGMGPLFECGVSPRLLPYFNWAEKQNIYGESGIPSVESIFDRLARGGIDYKVYSYHRFSDQQAIVQAQTDLTGSPARFFFLYLSELDHYLHAHCQDSDRVSERLAWYEAQLKAVLATALARDPRARITVMSDHGMTPVHSQYDLVGAIARLGFTMPQDYLSVCDSTMARFWFFNPAAGRAIEDELRVTKCGRILTDSELRKLGIYFTDHRYGELIFLFDAGWLFARSDFNGGGWQPSGMHGYDPADRHSDAIFLSNWQPARRPHSIVDLFGCFTEAAAC
jgi:hypothetical protein